MQQINFNGVVERIIIDRKTDDKEGIFIPWRSIQEIIIENFQLRTELLHIKNNCHD